MKSLFAAARRMLPTRRQGLVAFTLPAALLLIAHALGAGEALLESSIARPIAFSLRHLAKREPRMHPRVKIYAFGDSTKEYVQRDFLTLEEWMEIFTALAKTKPKAILVDFNFSSPFGESPEAFARQLRGLGVPIYVSSFVGTDPIRGRFPLTLDRDLFALGPSDADPQTDLPIRGGIAYGPHRLLVDGFAGYGQLQVPRHSDHAVAFWRLNQRQAIPHLGLLAAGKREWKDDRLFVDDKIVPLDRNGTFLLNYSHPSTYLERTFALGGLLRALRKKEAVEQPADALFVISSQMATGGHNTLATPFGTQPGALSLFATVNAALTGRWVSTLPLGWLGILLFSWLGTLLGYRAKPQWFWPGLGVKLAVAFGIGASLFVFLDIEAPWTSWCLAAFLSSILAFVDSVLVAERARYRLRQAFGGLVVPEQLERLMKHPETLPSEPLSRVVTMMFIDIVGFSAVAERFQPREVFTTLQALMSRFSRTVHEYGGVVDKTLGDGMLCFFGYQYGEARLVDDHADRAVECAMEIQRNALSDALAAPEGVRRHFAVRVGIHTGAVFIGNIGDENRIDMTLIGRGVNYCKRLETACDTYSILMSAATRDLLMRPEALKTKLVRKYIQVKHDPELHEAYECDPFSSDGSRRQKAVNQLREALGITRNDVRWTLPEGLALPVTSELGSGTLVNFSESGIGVRFSRYLGRGTLLNVSLGEEDDPLHRALLDLSLAPMMCEVRWGSFETDNVVVLGLQIKSLTKAQRKKLLGQLREWLLQREPAARAA